MLKKSVSMALTVLFVLSLIAVVSVSAQEKMQGTVMSVNADSGEIVVQDAAGETKTLMADPSAVDLKALKEGDAVSVEADADGAVKSIEVAK